MSKVESVQNKAALSITGAIQGTSQGKLLDELGLETHKSRKCFGKSGHCWMYFYFKFRSLCISFCMRKKTSNTIEAD